MKMNRAFIKEVLFVFSMTTTFFVIVSLTGFASVHLALSIGFITSVIFGISEYRKNKKGDD